MPTINKGIVGLYGFDNDLRFANFTLIDSLFALLLSIDRDRPHQDRWHNRHSRFNGSGPSSWRLPSPALLSWPQPPLTGAAVRNGNGCLFLVRADCFTREGVGRGRSRNSLSEVSGESVAPMKEESVSPPATGKTSP
jgi:hypothetical protein